MLRRTEPTPRPGYTLIELLVVILIISILAALTAAAVFKVADSGKKASAASEVNNLNIALTSFKQKYGFAPPAYVVESDGTGPQVRRFRIPNNVKQPEFAVLRRMFSRWNPQADPATGQMTTLQPTFAGLELDANQVMVYFLSGPGGIDNPANGLQTGWDVGGPFAPPPPPATTRKDPLYDFPANRLKPESGVHDGRFRDPWGTPYAYFSSNGSNYDPRFIFPWVSGGTTTFAWGTADVAPANYPATAPATYPGVAGSFQDPTEPTHLVHPLRSTGRWLQPNEFQIISAGPDRGFGAGSFISPGSPPTIRDWMPGTSEYMSGLGNTGHDDLANFNSGAPLGETGQ